MGLNLHVCKTYKVEYKCISYYDKEFWNSFIINLQDFAEWHDMDIEYVYFNNDDFYYCSDEIEIPINNFNEYKKIIYVDCLFNEFYDQNYSNEKLNFNLREKAIKFIDDIVNNYDQSNDFVKLVWF